MSIALTESFIISGERKWPQGADNSLVDEDGHQNQVVLTQPTSFYYNLIDNVEAVPPTQLSSLKSKCLIWINLGKTMDVLYNTSVC